MNRRVFPSVRPWAAVLLLGAFGGGCGSAPLAVEAPRPLRIVTGREGGGYFPLGEALAAHFNRTLQVRAVAEPTGGSVSNVTAVENGTADLGFVQSDVAYSAFQRGTARQSAPHTHLRSVAMLYVNAVHIVTRRDTSIRTVRDLKGTRVAFGSDPTGGGASRMIVDSHGLDYDALKPEYLSYEAISQKLGAGELDAAFFASGVPTQAVANLSRTVDVRLIPIEPEMLHRIRSEFPFYKAVAIPPGTYRGQHEAVQTLGADSLLICSDALSEELVFDLTRLVFEALPELAATHPTFGQIDPDYAPATPIPLHPGAARYYRQRELFR